MQKAGEVDDGEIRFLGARAVEQKCIGVHLQGERSAIGQPRRRVGQPRQRLRDRGVPVRIQGNRAGCGLARARELGQARRDVKG
jgi:hypothetical protein